LDFTPKTYHTLLAALQNQGYVFQPFADFLQYPAPQSVILRHDVEARYPNALRVAELQHKMGIRGTYYFRILNGHFHRDIIAQIADMGHEIGYHYGPEQSAPDHPPPKPHYRDYGIIGEPYFDVDYSKVLYLTDTRRRWDGHRVSVRDKIYAGGHPSVQTHGRGIVETHCCASLQVGIRTSVRAGDFDL